MPIVSNPPGSTATANSSSAMSTCAYKGQRVTVSTSSWSATEAQRRKACKQGYINTGYVVAIDGDRLSISADQNDTTQAMGHAPRRGDHAAPTLEASTFEPPPPSHSNRTTQKTLAKARLSVRAAA